MEKLSGTMKKRGLVGLAVVSVILSEDLCDFGVVEEKSCTKQRCADVCTDIRLLLPRRVESLDDAFFRNFFRISKHSLEKMLLFTGHRIKPQISDNLISSRNYKGRKYRRAISVTKKLLIFLQIISGGQVLDIAWGFGLCKSSVYNVFHEVTFAVYESQDIGHIYFPYGNKFELQQMSDKYQD